MKKRIAIALLILGSLTIKAEKTVVSSFKYAGPFTINVPFMVDSIDMNNSKFETISLLKTPLSLDISSNGTDFNEKTLPKCDGKALHLLSFTVDNDHFTTANLKVDGLRYREIYLDGKKINSGRMALPPATHTITIKCLSGISPKPDSIKVSIESDGHLNIGTKTERRLTLCDVVKGRRYASASLSPNGKYLITSYSHTHDGGSVTYTYQLSELATGRCIATRNEAIKWLPSSDRYYYVKRTDGKANLVSVNPDDGSETVMASNIPDSKFQISPTEDFLIYTKAIEGPKEKNTDLYEIVHPEDRQPGWRKRGTLMKFDFKSGLTTPLTFGNRNIGLAGISDNGKTLLFTVHETKAEARPSALTSLYIMDLSTNKSRCIVDKEGFIAGASLSPDGSKIAVAASPEAFGGIGKNLPDGMTPNMYDHQLYEIDIESGDISSLTRDFNPAIGTFSWNKLDGRIYFTANDRDLLSLYRVNPSDKKIENLGAREEYVTSFSMASNAPALVYFGQGANNSDRLYSLNTKNIRHKPIEDLSAERLNGIKIGKCTGWKFLSTRGDSINARYIVPADFDPSHKYPLIVNYYGGCNPTSRTFDSRYPHHLYAAHGYVVLVINPSGCTGFGQEFAARHVNTAGAGVAEDIIDGVKRFAEEFPWVDRSKIGCIGASYGGFMTQYLQTRTDIFAAAISHAGISDHTSYWGEGYWGYSYSEVCMANSYPWSHRDLYVNQSPLYNADKIHTPILFLHGDADTNVPVGESIQMYTALKRLGRETAFVAVKNANHQITDYSKRIQWQNTIFAWFAKYLQDDSSWWETMYPPKAL